GSRVLRAKGRASRQDGSAIDRRRRHAILDVVAMLRHAVHLQRGQQTQDLYRMAHVVAVAMTEEVDLRVERRVLLVVGGYVFLAVAPRAASGIREIAVEHDDVAVE